MRRSRKTIRNPETLGRKCGRRLSFDVTLDFHGYTLAEALRELEDELYTCDGESVLIIHGKGDGILRSGIRAFLKETDLPVSFEPGETVNALGGSGVTIVHT